MTDIAALVAKLDAPVEAGNPANRDAVVLYFDKVEEVSELRRIVVAAKEYADAWMEYDFIAWKDAVPVEVEARFDKAHEVLVSAVRGEA